VDGIVYVSRFFLPFKIFMSCLRYCRHCFVLCIICRRYVCLIALCMYACMCVVVIVVTAFCIVRMASMSAVQIYLVMFYVCV